MLRQLVQRDAAGVLGQKLPQFVDAAVLSEPPFGPASVHIRQGYFLELQTVLADYEFPCRLRRVRITKQLRLWRSVRRC